ncbi:MAG TPA: pyrroline-5-carboxylate reductase [Candidatus Hydrogenedens sp.]|mgnify:CR=1 FL=1|nr:pyrroline-5-carboxylate reductase [Candidatus Hydrogenedens sp.]HPP59756.1 pyrroline-5-carboxylate reductase [Candidatus Hydrogenedens sp.]
MLQNNPNLAVLGFGNMGQAIIKGLLRKQILTPEQIFIYDPDIEKQQTAKELNIQIAQEITTLMEKTKYLLIAVKPQIIQSALEPIKSQIQNDVRIISIAAGISINFYKTILNQPNLRIIRTMPNTPALVGEGITAISLSPECNENDKTLAQKIFESIGKIVFVPEEQINIITAVSGSGPAYFYYLCEAIIDAGKSLGLSEETTLSLVEQTFYGSAVLLMKEKELPQQLRARVTSKGGTTESAVNIFETENFKSIVNKAIYSAYKRAQELGK